MGVEQWSDRSSLEYLTLPTRHLRVRECFYSVMIFVTSQLYVCIHIYVNVYDVCPEKVRPFLI